MTDLYDATRLDTQTPFLALQDSVAGLNAARTTGAPRGLRAWQHVAAMRLARARLLMC